MKPPQYAIDRAKICKDCDSLLKATWTCKECFCFMKIKVLIPSVYCPLEKW